MEHIYTQSQFGEDWFTYPELYSDFVKNYLHNNSIFVEVGSWKGKSTAYIGVEIINSKKNIKCYAVDTWEGSPGVHDYDDYVKTNTLYQLFLSNISSLKDVIIPIKNTSVEAAKQFKNNSIDVVYIDANHEYEYIKEDIHTWYPKVKPGGIISGHDYLFPGVYKAVHEYFPFDLKEYTGNCWVYRKPLK
jgi:predicted O-methyltransferase YrrM